jgi:hypothetical protein
MRKRCFLFDSRNPHCYQINPSIGIHSLSSQYNVTNNPKRIGKCLTLLLTVVNQPAPVFKIRIELLDYWEGKRGRGNGETLYLSLNKDAPEERVQELAELGMIRTLPMVGASSSLHQTCYLTPGYLNLSRLGV